MELRKPRRRTGFGLRTYAIDPVSPRVISIEAVSGIDGLRELTLVDNWFEKLTRLVPTP